MKPIRVLRIIHDLQVGGVQRMMFKQLAELEKLGVHCDVCCLEGRGPLADQFDAAGHRVKVIQFRSRLDPFGLLKLRRFALKSGYDLVHAHMYASNVAANVALIGQKRVPVVNGYHSTIPVRGPRQTRHLRRTHGLATAFVAVSECVRDVLIPLGLDPRKIRVVPNGTATPDAPPPHRERQPGDPLRLLWAGRFVDQKRLPRFIEVARLCRDRNIPAKFTIVGDGPIRARLVAQIEAENLGQWIAMPGLSHDVPAYLRETDLFASMSSREGMSNAVLEACASGRGLVVSDIPPHLEVLHQGPEAGIALSDDPEAWAPVLAELAADPARVRAMGDVAFRIGQFYSLSESARKMAEYYREILANA